MLAEIVPGLLVWLAGFAVGYVVREMVRPRGAVARRRLYPPLLP